MKCYLLVIIFLFSFLINGFCNNNTINETQNPNFYYQDTKLINNGIIIMIFTANWCGYCHYLKRDLLNILADYEKINIVEVDIDKYPLLAEKVGISVVPTTVIYKKSSKMKIVDGYSPNLIISLLLSTINE